MLDFCHYLQSASGILACLWSFKASLWQLEGLAERRILRCQNLQSIATRNTSVSFGSVEITIWIYRRGTMNPIGLIIRSPWSPHRHHNSTPSQSLSGGNAKVGQGEALWKCTAQSSIYHTMDLAYLPSRRDVNSWWLCDKLIWNVRTSIRTCDKPCVPGEMM